MISRSNRLGLIKTSNWICVLQTKMIKTYQAAINGCCLLCFRERLQWTWRRWDKNCYKVRDISGLILSHLQQIYLMGIVIISCNPFSILFPEVLRRISNIEVDFAVIWCIEKLLWYWLENIPSYHIYFFYSWHFKFTFLSLILFALYFCIYSLFQSLCLILRYKLLCKQYTQSNRI